MKCNSFFFFHFGACSDSEPLLLYCESQSSANKFKKMVLHFGKTCFCLIILPQKKTLQFTLFSVATSVFGVFFVKHQEKQNLDYGCFFISFRFGRTFFKRKKKKVLNKRQNDKKKEFAWQRTLLPQFSAWNHCFLLFGLWTFEKAVGSRASEIVHASSMTCGK